MKASYEALGYEVRIEPYVPDDDEECTSCFTLEGFSDKYKTIYTRGEPRDKGAGAEDLFD
jgi:hypothetical protein